MKKWTDIDIMNFIVQIERDFPVNDWKIDGLHLWPILRIKLYFHLIYAAECKSSKTPLFLFSKTQNNFKRKVKNKIKKYFSILNYLIWKFKLPQKDYIFVGADSHRVNYRESRFNRYFDVLIEKENLQENAIYFEYASDLNNQYNSKHVYKFNDALKGFIHLKKRIVSKKKSFNRYSDFLLFLNEEGVSKSFTELNSQNKLIDWFEKRFGLKVAFFKKTVKKIAPKQIAVLCYYSEDLYALIAAANSLKIRTIEMQHGPQNEMHLAYGSWNAVPENGYEVLPRVYWCWDTYSASVLNQWASKNDLYTVEVIGNPWANYWKKKTTQYEFKNFILYSLQPTPVSLEQLFTPAIIQLIRNSEFMWFLRLHPRQMNQKSEIKQLLRKEKVLNLVNIDNATNDPLPQLLMNAKIHVSHFSGTTLEASLFELTTIIVNEVGVKSFPHLIDNKEAYFIDYRDRLFVKKFNEILQDV